MIGMEDKKALRLEWIEAGSLAEHPSNWRRHPPGQLSALKSVIDEVGWAGALLYNERTKRLIDGHARKQVVDPKTPVPVLIGDWSEEAERKILATLDPLAAMAEADAEALEALLKDTELPKEISEELIALLPKGDPAGTEFDESTGDDVKMVTCPKCQHEFPL